MFTVATILPPDPGSPLKVVLFLTAGGFLLVSLAILLGLWLLLGRGPRQSRAHHRAQRLLHQGAWQDALALVQRLQEQGGLSNLWQERLRNLAGECYHKAGDAALAEQKYEESWQHYQTAANLLSLDTARLCDQVIDAMLAEARRLFAGDNNDLASAQALLKRLLETHAPCPEASFWQGLCLVRAGSVDQALAALATAGEGTSQRYLDPPLYLGTLHLRQGRPQEALRYLAEANRIDNGCALIPWQLGMAIVAAGGDSRVAVQALQRACGPRGLGVWSSVDRSPTADPREANRFWVEGLPENRSYVRRLAQKHPFSCPVFGNDVSAMIRQGQLALAQAHYRLDNFQEAADVYAKLLQESPPTVPLLRGLGLALARLGRYDQAYKQLRIAFEQEEPKDSLTAGYLALCGALGKPAQEGDKPRNVAWAIRLLARFPITSDPEWAGLASTVFAEARSCGLAVPAEDQVRLCNLLASVNAVDPAAATAYDHLAATHPEALQPVHAWLYAWATHQHGWVGQRDLELLALTFREEPAARAYYAERKWDLDEVEYTYLSRYAASHPGKFPPELGEEYPARGETRLLARSQQQETAGQMDASLATADVLFRLVPRSAAAHDRLAYLHYQRGDLAAASSLLVGWHRLEPRNFQPLCRIAAIEQQRGKDEVRRQAIARALDLTRPPTRAAIAFLGARLALQAAGGGQPAANGDTDKPTADLGEARELLQRCLQDEPNHVDALWQLAAVRSLTGDREGLAQQAAVMDRPQVRDNRFHYLAAVCHLAARDYPRVVAAAQRSATDPTLAADSHYLMGWVHLQQDDRAAAAASLQKAAAVADSASVDHARALLGRLHFERSAFEEALGCWSALAPEKRHTWQLDETLRSTVFLAGLLAYQEERFEQAAARFREAGRLGLRERRLGSLLSLSLFRAGQRLLFGGS